MIQVAAVAVAMVEDLDYGQANAEGGIVQTGLWTGTQVGAVLHEVRAERQRQDKKWGPQHHDPQGWMLILMEEVGEIAEETRPYATADPSLKTQLVRDIVVLGKKAKELLDENEGMPE